MSFTEAVKSVFSKYATAAGRARRSEFWYFELFNIIASTIIGLIGHAVGFNILSSIYTVAVLVPSICVGIRRLHDIGKSGWFMLLELIPVVGFIILLVWDCKDSQPGANEYGPNPKEQSF